MFPAESISPKMASFSYFSMLLCFLSLWFLLLLSGFSEAQVQRRRSVLAHGRIMSADAEEYTSFQTTSTKKKSQSKEQEERTLSPTMQKKKKTQYMVEDVEEEESSSLHSPSKKKGATTTATAAETKNQIELMKPIKSKSSNSSLAASSLSKSHLNKTLTATTKPSNSTKLTKPVKLNSTAATKTNVKAPTQDPTKLQKPQKTTDLPLVKTTAKTQKQHPSNPKSVSKPIPIMPWLDNTDTSSDIISEFRDLPSQLHQTLLPDLSHLSTKSKAYLTLANKEFTKTFKPIVGTKYASTVATLTSLTFLLLPLTLITILFHHLRHYSTSLPKILLSIHIYLAIYFSLLSFTSLATGLEPLRFFYVTSPGSYVYTQVLQTLGYVLYLLLLLMNLVVVFSTSDGGDRIEMGSSRMLGLAQVVVALALGLHYYAAVFHRAMLGEPPKTNWKIHAVYALCFIVICAFARADRSKKAYYLHDGGGDGKKS